MSEVKWIKITTDMFNDKKIRMIEMLPEADAILIIWIKLITMAGECNSSGYVYFTESKPYTEEMLAALFDKPITIIRLALKTFLDFNMIEIDDKGIYLINFWKHQNLDGLDKIREQNRLRFKKYYDNKKQLKLADKNSNVRTNVDLTHTNATDIDIDKELDKDIEEEIEIDKKKIKIPYKEIVDLYNSICVSLPKVKEATKNRREHIGARFKHYKSIEVFREVFEKTEKSDFLTNRYKTKRWRADFDWLMNETNIAKVLEGKYDNEEVADSAW